MSAICRNCYISHENFKDDYVCYVCKSYICYFCENNCSNYGLKYIRCSFYFTFDFSGDTDANSYNVCTPECYLENIKRLESYPNVRCTEATRSAVLIIKKKVNWKAKYYQNILDNEVLGITDLSKIIVSYAI